MENLGENTMKKLIKVLTTTQIEALLSGTWGRSQDRDRHMLIFLLNTGLKINEFVSLNVGDVYTGKRVKKMIHIPGSEDTAPRKVPMNRQARESIAMILDYNRTQGLELKDDEPFLISRQRNQKDNSYRITPRQVQRIVKSLREDASLGFKTTPQTLRHTFAKTVLEGGANMEQLQKLLGHRSIKTTRDLYGEQGQALR